MASDSISKKPQHFFAALVDSEQFQQRIMPFVAERALWEPWLSAEIVREVVYQVWRERVVLPRRFPLSTLTGTLLLCRRILFPHLNGFEFHPVTRWETVKWSRDVSNLEQVIQGEEVVAAIHDYLTKNASRLVDLREQSGRKITTTYKNWVDSGAVALLQSLRDTFQREKGKEDRHRLWERAALRHNVFAPPHERKWVALVGPEGMDISWVESTLTTDPRYRTLYRGGRVSIDLQAWGEDPRNASVEAYVLCRFLRRFVDGEQADKMCEGLIEDVLAYRDLLSEQQESHGKVLLFLYRVLYSSWLEKLATYLSPAHFMVVFTTPDEDVARQLNATVVPIRPPRFWRSRPLYELIKAEMEERAGAVSGEMSSEEERYRHMACTVVDFVEPAVRYLEGAAARKGWKNVAFDLVDREKREETVWRGDTGHWIHSLLEDQWRRTDADDRRRLLDLASLPLLNRYTVEDCSILWRKRADIVSLWLARLAQNGWLKRLSDGSYRLAPLRYDFLLRKRGWWLRRRVREARVLFRVALFYPGPVFPNVPLWSREYFRWIPRRIRHPRLGDVDPTHRGWSYLQWLHREVCEATTDLRLEHIAFYLRLRAVHTHLTLAVLLWIFVWAIGLAPRPGLLAPALLWSFSPLPPAVLVGYMIIVQLNAFFTPFKNRLMSTT